MKCHRLWHGSKWAAGYRISQIVDFEVVNRICVRPNKIPSSTVQNAAFQPCAVQITLNFLWEITFSTGDQRLLKHKPSAYVSTCVCVCVPICARQAHPQSDLHHFSIAPAVSQASHPLSHWLLKGALGTLCADTRVPETAGWSSPASQPVNCLSCTNHLSLSY